MNHAQILESLSQRSESAPLLYRIWLQIRNMPTKWGGTNWPQFTSEIEAILDASGVDYKDGNE